MTDPPTGNRRHPVRWWLAALIVAASVASSCGGSGSDDASPGTSSSSTAADRSTTTGTTGTTSSTTTSTTSPSGSTSSTSVPSTGEQEIIDRYLGYWAARFGANSGTPNPDDPALREYATGRQLEAVITETRGNLEGGFALQHRDDRNGFQQVTVLSVEGDTAVVQECFVDDDLIVRRDTGEVVNDAIATHNVRGEMNRVDGSWRVSEARLIQRWEGVAGCAAGS